MKLVFLMLILLIIPLSKAQDCHQLLKKFLSSNNERQEVIIDENFNLKDYGLENTPINRINFEKLYIQCLSPEKNDARNLASKRLERIFMGMSYLTTIIGYSHNNWEQPKDKEWFGRLGYNFIFSAVLSKIHLKIIQNKDNPFHYIVKDYLFNRGAVIAYLGTNNFIIPSNPTFQKQFNELQSSKHFQQDLKELEKYIDENNMANRFQQELSLYLSAYKDLSLNIGIHNNIDFDHLSPEDLKDPNVQEVIMAAIIAKNYERKNSDNLISTGNSNADFFLYDSLYSILKIPKDIFVSNLTNKIMCLHQFNPKRGLIQAIGINTLNQIIFADYYGITYTILKDKII